MLLFSMWDKGWHTLVAFFIVIVFAFAYHELGHAIVADRLGDPTPRRHGRITLALAPHLSLVGLLTLFLVGFGGASTPVNPSLLKGNQRRAYMWVTLAGPIANIIMALIFAMLYRIHSWVAPVGDPLISENMHNFVRTLIFYGGHINIFLAVFNLLPIPPLDGFRIFLYTLPPALADHFKPILRHGIWPLIVVLIVMQMTGFDLIAPGSTSGVRWVIDIASSLAVGATLVPGSPY